MSRNLIANDQLSDKEVSTLSGLLDTLIPANLELNMPSAGEARIVQEFHRSVRNTLDSLKSTLATLNSIAETRHDLPFEQLSFDARNDCLNDENVTNSAGIRSLMVVTTAVLLQRRYRYAGTRYGAKSSVPGWI